MISVWRYLGGTVIRPHGTFQSLQADPKKISKSVRAFLLIGILYAATVAGLAVSGALIMAPAFIALSPENYYFWEMFFVIPVFFLDWILAAGLSHLLSRAGKGSGSFEGMFAALGFAFSIPFIITWIPETTMTVLLLLGMKQQEWVDMISQPGLLQVIFLGSQFIACFLLIVLTVVATAVIQKLRWWRAILIGVPTAIVFLVVMIIFIR